MIDQEKIPAGITGAPITWEDGVETRFTAILGVVHWIFMGDPMRN